MDESLVQALMPKHIYMSIHETARASSVICLCRSFWLFLCFFFCKCSPFLDDNKISLAAGCRKKSTCSVCQEELGGRSSSGK